AARAWVGLTRLRTTFYDHRDGSPSGDQKGMRCGDFPNAAAAPATVSGELPDHRPLGFLTWEGDREAITREARRAAVKRGHERNASVGVSRSGTSLARALGFTRESLSR